MPVDMKKVSQKDRAIAQEIMFRRLISGQEIHSCLNCVNWSRNGLPPSDPEECIKYGALPPAETIVFGCDFWEPDIPF